MVLYGEPYYSFRPLADCGRTLPDSLQPLVTVEYTIDGTHWVSAGISLVDVTTGGETSYAGTLYKEHLQALLPEDVKVKSVRVGVDYQRNTITANSGTDRIVPIENWQVGMYLANVTVKGNVVPDDTASSQPSGSSSSPAAGSKENPGTGGAPVIPVVLEAALGFSMVSAGVLLRGKSSKVRR